MFLGHAGSETRGIISTRVGYTGDIPNATYRTHAEGIEIVFDPTVTSYRNILEFFFQIHDPTTLNRQAMIVGSPTGRASIMSREARVAEDTIARGCLGAVGWQSGDRGPAGRRVLGGRARPGLSGEGGYTCHFVRPGWCFRSAKRLTTYSQPGPRRNRLHCRCHCAGPVASS